MRNGGDPGEEDHPGLSLLIGGGFALACLFLLPLAFVSDDLQFLTGMELGNARSFDFWLPSRFLWQLTGSLVYRVGRVLGAPEMALPTVQIFNVLVSAAVLVAFHRLLAVAGCGRRAATLATLGLAFSAYFWSWSMRVKMYPAHFLFVVLLLLCVWAALRGTGRTLWPGGAAGLCAGCALYYHQSAWLLVGVTLLAVPALLRRRAGGFLGGFLGGLALAFSLFPLVHAVYYAGNPATRGFLAWYTFEWRLDYQQRSHIGGFPSAARVADYGADVWCGAVNDPERNVFTRYAVARPPQGPPVTVQDLRYDEVPEGLRGTLARAAGGARAVASPLLAAALLLGLGLGLPRLRGARVALAVFLAAALAAYLVGFLVLDWTGYLYYAAWVFAWALLGLALSEAPPWTGALAAAAVGAVLAHNLLTGMLPQALASNHRLAREVTAARAAVGPSDVVVCAGTSPDAWYWTYFARCQALDLTQVLETRPPDEAWSYVVEHLDGFLRGGMRVLVDERALSTSYAARGEPVPGFAERLRRHLESGYRLRQETLPGGLRVYVLEGPLS